ncbi:MAG: hypothetical protein OSA99_14430 [Acidimicrobiales bacterium]|nr:hypothetical protein [Acidimicrobiales bacterium]
MIRRLAVALVAMLVAAGCSGDDAVDSATPRITAEEGGELSSFVLAAESIGSVDGFEGVVAQELGDVQVFENPDPRGPCGGSSPAPPLEDTAGRSFAAEGVSVVQVVASGADVDAYVDAQLDDIADPCGPYDSTTNVETVQTVDSIDIVPLADESGFFSTARIQNAGQTIYGGSAIIRVDDVTSLVFVVGVEPIALTSMESLARLVDAQLRSG